MRDADPRRERLLASAWRRQKDLLPHGEMVLPPGNAFDPAGDRGARQGFTRQGISAAPPYLGSAEGPAAGVGCEAR